MIMKIFSLENDITFTEEYINVLQIQDKKLFTDVINSLNDNINNIEDTKERIIILDNDIEIKKVLKKVVGVFVLTLAIRNVYACTSFSYVLLRLTQRHRQLSSAPS